MGLASGNLLHSYGKRPFIDVVPIENGDFPSKNLSLPEGTLQEMTDSKLVNVDHKTKG